MSGDLIPRILMLSDDEWRELVDAVYQRERAFTALAESFARSGRRDQSDRVLARVRGLRALRESLTQGTGVAQVTRTRGVSAGDRA